MKSKRGGGNMNNNNMNLGSNNNNSNNSDGGDYNMVIIIVIALIILGVLVYFGYKYLNSYQASQSVTKTFIPFIHDAKEPKRFTNGSIPKSTQGNEYNYNLWVYVADYSHRNEDDKCILYKGDVGDSNFNSAQNTEENPNRMGNPSMWLLRKNNTLRVQIALETRYDDIQSCSMETFDGHNNAHVGGNAGNNNGNNAGNNSGNGSNQNEVLSKTCDIEHFPLQRWVCVNISLTNNILDISFNGDLVKSCMLPGAPVINNSDLLVCPSGGFNGFIANLNVSDKALGSEEIKSIYRKGPTLKPGLLG
tara:strand:- start:656 stop:1570 length:915 start_codon:yes stop_codon:yes gene_type:complete